MRVAPTLLASLVALVWLGCDTGTAEDRDGSTPLDASRRDAATRRDGAAPDAGPNFGTDAGPPDAGPPPNALANLCPASPGSDPFAGVDNRTATRVLTPQMLAWDGNDNLFLEGPVWVASRNTLYFSNMNFRQNNDLGVPPSRIHSYVPEATSFGIAVPDSGSNGLALLPDGALAVAYHGDRADTQAIRRLTLDPVASTVLVGGGTPRFNSPNDVAVRSDGHLYFTDPNWQRGSRAMVQMAVYHRRPNGELATVEDGDAPNGLDRPNGVSLAPDGRRLYWSEANGTLRTIALDAAGEPTGNPSLFARQSSDGMAVDCAGNVYATSGGNVVVLDPGGDEIGRIGGFDGATNAAFGDADRRTLYITARNGLWRIRLAIAGFPF